MVAAVTGTVAQAYITAWWQRQEARRDRSDKLRDGTRSEPDAPVCAGSAPAFNSRRSWRTIEAGGDKPVGLLFDERSGDPDGDARDAEIGRYAREKCVARDRAAARWHVTIGLFMMLRVPVSTDDRVMRLMRVPADRGSMNGGALRQDGVLMTRCRKSVRMGRRNREDRDRPSQAQRPKETG